MSANRRLLICSPGIPHPSCGASIVLFHHYIQRLKREGFNILNLLLLDEHTYDKEALDEYMKRVAEPGRFQVIACRADRFIEYDRYGQRLRRRVLSEALNRAEVFQPDCVFAIDLLSAWATREIAAQTKIVWLGDLNFQTQWYHWLYSVKEKPHKLTSFPRTWLRGRSWKRTYRQVLSDTDLVVVSSKSSEGQLRRLGISSTYLPYPWPVESETKATQKNDKPSFLLMGTLVGLGSKSAFHFLIRSVYPKLVKRWGKDGFQIFIAGRYELPGWVEKAIAAKTELKYLGFVDDLETLMSSCHAVLAPIDVPVGNRCRILTAMANRSLVIAHRNTSLGNPDLVDDYNCLLATYGQRFADCMQRAVNEPEQVATIIENARHTYENRFAPEKATTLFMNELSRIINKQPARQAA